MLRSDGVVLKFSECVAENIIEKGSVQISTNQMNELTDKLSQLVHMMW